MVNLIYLILVHTRHLGHNIGESIHSGHEFILIHSFTHTLQCSSRVNQTLQVQLVAFPLPHANRQRGPWIDISLQRRHK